jgi:dihydroorotase-like cyclic amidohydrolase
VLTDEKLNFDTRFKAPPLRTERIEALLKGVLDNTIDMITDHQWISNIRKWSLIWPNGTIGLESALCALMTVYHLENSGKLLGKIWF